ncbi:MAG: regulatory protein RecX [Archangium sp.]
MDALTQVTKLLAGREKTRAQLHADLVRRGFDDKDIDTALERAKELGYLDDSRVARRTAVASLRDGWVGDALIARLQSKGIDEATAREALEDAITELSWKEADAAKVLLKKRNLDGVKAARFLASRGFSEDVVNRVGNA